MLENIEKEQVTEDFPRLNASSLLANENFVSDRPKVSVLIVAFNQEDYVRQAIESVLMQRTNFDFEVLIADDFSEDATPAIAGEYDAAYPKVRLLRTTRHLGITQNYKRGFAACRGEYVAILEADDYWTSPIKLALMSNFLDAHRDCVLCFHRVIRHDETSDETAIYPSVGTVNQRKYFTADELASHNFIPGFSSCTYRRETIVGLDPALGKLKVREWPFNIVVAQNGRIGYLPETLSVYRVHPGGIWSMKSDEERFQQLEDILGPYNEYLNFKYDAEFRTIQEQSVLHVRKDESDSASSNAPIKPAPKQQIKNWLKPFLPPIVVSIARKIDPRRLV